MGRRLEPLSRYRALNPCPGYSPYASLSLSKGTTPPKMSIGNSTTGTRAISGSNESRRRFPGTIQHESATHETS